MTNIVQTKFRNSIVIASLFLLASCALSCSPKDDNGISWPSTQALPIFSAPADVLDKLHTPTLAPDERVTISALQGIVNKSKPRILLTESGDIPPETWVNTFKLQTVDMEAYDMIVKYKDEVRGLVVYDVSKSEHYRNVASTIANLNGGYLPVTNTVKDNISTHGVEFQNIIDITDWTETTPLEIYGRLYDQYWQYCSKRLLLSARPANRGDLDHCRDVAAAVGAAVVWLDCTRDDEKALYQKFMKDMADNREKNNQTAIVLGWFTTERSGVVAGSEFGISTIPADVYISGSVYSGVTYNDCPNDRTINVPAVPPKNDIENKVYVTVFFTDGDNIQYVQRFMRRLWDRSEDDRGKVPANWTIAPGLVDIGPGLLNYYYSIATDNECFVAGPSGMGYLMPINTNRERGIGLGNFVTERKYMDEFTKLTERYMRQSGLRSITIWDDLNDDFRQSFEQNCRYIYGATVQNFGAGDVSGGILNNRLWFSKLETHYEGRLNAVLTDMTDKIEAFENSESFGKEPLFLSYQVQTWEFHTPQLVSLHDSIKEIFENRVEIEFVRADHFFAYFNEANGMPFNLCMNQKTVATSSDAASKPENAKNGSQAILWTAKGAGNQWLQFDFGDIYTITRFAVINPSHKFKIELSIDGKMWEKAGEHKANKLNTVENYFDKDIGRSINARYARITFAGSDVSVGDVEIYGHVGR